jgi:hypothetical protein
MSAAPPPPAFSTWDPRTPAQYGRAVAEVERAYGAVYGRQPGRGFGVASLVLGIVALAGCWLPVISYGATLMAAIGIGLGIAGLRRHASRGLAIAGMVLAPIALAGAITASIYWTGVFADAVHILEQCQEAHPDGGPAFDRCIDRGGPDPRTTSGTDA